jgi:methylated-DNA-[protein]-cysteine S-methyltransferase
MSTSITRDIQSPLGLLSCLASPEGLVALCFQNQKDMKKKEDPQLLSFLVSSKKRFATSEAVLDETERQLREYFQGNREHFDLPLVLKGTDFQLKVWKQLLEIPFGETISYKTLADRVGSAGASRAVGSANGSNSIPIIIPCHRVISSDGSFGGYSGGLSIKRELLHHEKPLFQKENKIVFCEQI